jgi:hypothetical protein
MRIPILKSRIVAGSGIGCTGVVTISTAKLLVRVSPRTSMKSPPPLNPSPKEGPFGMLNETERARV